jgi:hypothetical protein
MGWIECNGHTLVNVDRVVSFRMFRHYEADSDESLWMVEVVTTNDNVYDLTISGNDPDALLQQVSNTLARMQASNER